MEIVRSRGKFACDDLTKGFAADALVRTCFSTGELMATYTSSWSLRYTYIILALMIYGPSTIGILQYYGIIYIFQLLVRVGRYI